MAFSPRLIKPDKNNKYYITKNNGGYSSAIKGSPVDSCCDVLANCVGYAYGRFHEIAKDTKMSYCCPVNAEDFPEYIKNCKVGNTPKLGSIIVWKKGNINKSADGAGHVAVVERILSDTQILISQSGYKNKNIFWTEIVTKSGNNWKCSWMGNDYVFRCFIYNPKVSDAEANIITLMNGSKGDLVKALQINLNTIGNYKLVVDGSFGPACEKAVKDFQKKSNLVIDGLVGPATQEMIIKYLAECKKPENVLDLKILLNNKSKNIWAVEINNQYYLRVDDLINLGILKSATYNNTKKALELK